MLMEIVYTKDIAKHASSDLKIEYEILKPLIDSFVNGEQGSISYLLFQKYNMAPIDYSNENEYYRDSTIMNYPLDINRLKKGFEIRTVDNYRNVFIGVVINRFMIKNNLRGEILILS
jgi:hypothetical protein